MHTPDTGTVTRIARAFDAAAARFMNAGSLGAQEDETSNMLHQLYRLAVHVHGDPIRGREGTGWEALISESAEDDGGLVPPLVLLRHKDVHDHVLQSKVTDAYTTVYTSLYGVLRWRLESFMDDDPRTHRYFARKRLDDHNVIDTLLAARGSLAS